MSGMNGGRIRRQALLPEQLFPSLINLRQCGMWLITGGEDTPWLGYNDKQEHEGRERNDTNLNPIDH
jgi:hypothetical protein